MSELFKNYGDRRTGSTTRLADKLVQDFFTDRIAICHDDTCSNPDTQRDLNRRLMEIVLRRLQTEHGISYKDLSIDKIRAVIYVSKDEKSNELYSKYLRLLKY